MCLFADCKNLIQLKSKKTLIDNVNIALINELAIIFNKLNIKNRVSIKHDQKEYDFFFIGMVGGHL